MQYMSEPNHIFQLTKDHRAMTDVLFGRNLRLKVAFTLWQRNVGELLTYFLRYVVRVLALKQVTRDMFNFQKCCITVFVQNPRHWSVCRFSPTDKQKVSIVFGKNLRNTACRFYLNPNLPAALTRTL